eukprot:986047-Alexandrium_andersonii.AAC.1
MSASLVGSEMCIRDRSHIGPAAAHQHHHGHPAEHQMGPNAQLDGAAVSYTHLTLPTICSV